MTTRTLGPVAFLFLSTLLCGCSGPDTAEVSGKVTLKSQPPKIDGLTMSFMAADGRPVTVLVAEDGSYTATSVPVGEVKIGFRVARLLPPRDDKPKEGESPEAFEKRMKDPKEHFKRIQAEQRAAKASKAATLIPNRYIDPLKSGVTTTLNPGPNTFDFDIK